MSRLIAIAALALGLVLLVAMWAAPPPLAFTDRWVPLLKRDEAACSWVLPPELRAKTFGQTSCGPSATTPGPFSQ